MYPSKGIPPFTQLYLQDSNKPQCYTTSSSHTSPPLQQSSCAAPNRQKTALPSTSSPSPITGVPSPCDLHLDAPPKRLSQSVCGLQIPGTPFPSPSRMPPASLPRTRTSPALKDLFTSYSGLTIVSTVLQRTVFKIHSPLPPSL